MAETKIYIDDKVDGALREIAMKRFGYGRGSISKAVEEAVVQWLRMQDNINSKISRIVEAAKSNEKVVAVILFGSYARKEADYKDVDIAVLLEDGSDSFVELNRLDVIGAYEDRMFDIAVLNDVPLEIKRRILNEGIVVYTKDSSALYNYSIKVIRDIDEFGCIPNTMR